MIALDVWPESFLVTYSFQTHYLITRHIFETSKGPPFALPPQNPSVGIVPTVTCLVCLHVLTRIVRALCFANINAVCPWL